MWLNHALTYLFGQLWAQDESHIQWLLSFCHRFVHLSSFLTRFLLPKHAIHIRNDTTRRLWTDFITDYSSRQQLQYSRAATCEEVTCTKSLNKPHFFYYRSFYHFVLCIGWHTIFPFNSIVKLSKEKNNTLQFVSVSRIWHTSVGTYN